MISNFVNLYTNQTLVNNLITSPKPNVNSIVPDYLSGDFSEYKDTIDDYAEISQEAIDAYKADVAKGSLQTYYSSNNFLYDHMTTAGSNKNKIYGMNADIMLGFVNRQIY